MRFTLDADECQDLSISARKEWLLTNGLGGYAMGTASGINTRRYHGLLVAAVKPPSDRMVLLAGLECHIQADGKEFGLSSNQYPGTVFPDGYKYIESFEANGRASWCFSSDEFTIDKSVEMRPQENAVVIEFANRGKMGVALQIRPLVCHKPYHANFTESKGYPESLTFPEDHTVITHAGIAIDLAHPDASRTPVQGWYYRFEHQVEIERGLDPRDDLFCPCELYYRLGPGEKAAITASTSAGAGLERNDNGPTGESLREALACAAKKFLVQTPQRTSIIAGYPWFTDWGRDTMVSLPGICLHTGNVEAAKQILTDYAGQMKQGIIPNRFVEEGESPEYNTVDATLWFVNAAYRTLKAEWDAKFAKALLPVLAKVYDWHNRGTFYGIKVDPADGLLTQGEEGMQLTWMDAKIGDWVVTPRHGKPVEVNGLWINALRVMEWLAHELDDPAEATYKEAGNTAESNFERKFWSPRRGHYLDTADPDDASLRPNQLISMALPFGPAKGPNGLAALQRVEQDLLTPRGVRTLGPSEPGYRGRYRGALQELDASYHQGTAWPWLLGSYISACVRLRGNAEGLGHWLEEFKTMMLEGGLGGIAEVYDGDEPRAPGGCPWQAWSVGELLRVACEELA